MGLQSILIRNVEIDGNHGLDVLCTEGVVRSIGKELSTQQADRVVDANGGALLRGLHDRHIHLFSLAASRTSVQCGPPAVDSRSSLVEKLRCVAGNGWIRGVGYHESVAGQLTRWRMDELCGSRPVRIQHRSGKLWVLNSLGCELVGLSQDHDGQLFRHDVWLRSRLKSEDALFDDMYNLSKELASHGITNVTDATPSNNPETHELLERLMPDLSISVMGNESLEHGERKLLLDDYQFPLFENFCNEIEAAHDQARNVAIHCVTRAEVVFALSALQTVGCRVGDRLEHASVTDEACLAQIRELPLTVVTQPSFIRERGDRYLLDVSVGELDWLYRAKSFVDAGVRLVGGSDAPFGSFDPWLAIDAAIDRRTLAGEVVNAKERMDVDAALNLFAPGPITSLKNIREVHIGDQATVCVLRKTWDEVKLDLRSTNVMLTVNNGQITFDRTTTRQRLLP